MVRLDLFKDITEQRDMIGVSLKLRVNDQELYESYLIKIIDEYGYQAFPPQSTDPYFLESTNNPRYHFLEIDMLDGDSVGMFYKVYNWYGVDGSYLWFKPISLNGNVKNEQIILQHLVDNRLIDVLLIPEVFSHINYKKLTQRNDDYYCLVSERLQEINRSKYRSSKGINKLKNGYNIEMKINEFDSSELHELSYYWWKLHKRPNKKFDKYLDNLLMLPNDKKWVLTWHLDGKLLGFSLITKHFKDIPVARIQHNRNILKTELDIGDPFLMRNLADYMHYWTMQFINDEGYKYAFIGDAFGSGKYLAPYKARNFNKRVDNFNLPIDRYMELYK